MHTKYWSENLKGIDHSEDLGVDGKLILERILDKQNGKLMDLTYLAQDKDHWQALANTVMVFFVP